MTLSQCSGETYYLSSQEQILAVAKELTQYNKVALDTEADSLHHYYEKICLIQLSFSNHHYVIDPLGPVDLEPLFDVLLTRVLIFHGADYDLRMLWRCYHFRPREIFDTMLAAKMLGYTELSLSALVKRFCGVALSKHGQRADWSRRPLSPELIAYATNDTRHLGCIADKLAEELRQQGKLTWHQESCQKLISNAIAGCQKPKNEEGRWRIKGWHTLSTPRAQAILHELWHWREEEARRADIPPFKILRNEKLLELACWADSTADMETIPQLPKHITGQRFTRLCNVIEKSRHMHESQFPPPQPHKRSHCQTSKTIDWNALRRLRDAIAHKHQLSPELLLSNSQLAILVQKLPQTMEEMQRYANLCPWQAKALGQEFLEAIQQLSKSVHNT